MLKMADFKPFALRSGMRFLQYFIAVILSVSAIAFTIFFHARVYRVPTLNIPEISETRSESASQRKKPSPHLYQNIHTYSQKNDDFMAWIEIDGTSISEPVFRAEDNEYYQKKDSNRIPSFAGSIYLDHRNDGKNRSTISDNMFVYGNYISVLGNYYKKDGFSHLPDFKNLEFAQEHQYITYATTEDEMSFEIFSVLSVDSNTFSEKYMTDGKVSVDLVMEDSKFFFQTTVLSTDKLLILSTADYHTPGKLGERFVVVARLMEPNDELVDKEILVNEKK